MLMPFMYAVLYADAATLEQLLKKGADPIDGDVISPNGTSRYLIRLSESSAFVTSSSKTSK
jgi:hypothetical protein